MRHLWSKLLNPLGFLWRLDVTFVSVKNIQKASETLAKYLFSMGLD